VLKLIRDLAEDIRHTQTVSGNVRGNDNSTFLLSTIYEV